MQHRPTVWDKLRMGAMMGATVGLGLGFFIGNLQYLAYGALRKGYLGTVSSSMLASAGSFAFFLGIGSVIRN